MKRRNFMDSLTRIFLFCAFLQSIVCNSAAENLLNSKESSFEAVTSKETEKYPGVPDGWDFYPHSSFAVLDFFGIDSSTSVHGQNSLKIVFGDFGALSFMRLCGCHAPGVSGKHVFSAYMKSDPPGARVKMAMIGKTKRTTKIVRLDAEWNLYSMIIENPDHSRNDPIFRFFREKDMPSDGVTIWIDAVSFNPGSTPLPLKDIEKVISKITSEKLSAIPISKAPEINGILDDACWKKAPVVEKFKNNFFDGGPITEKTSVRICYDTKYLFFGWMCLRAKMPGNAGGIKKITDDKNLFAEDCLEIFLKPAKKESYYHFAAGISGKRYDALGFDEAWNGAWLSSVSPCRDGWSAEIAIPFNEIIPESGEAKFRLGLFRENQAKDEYSGWIPTGKGFHSPLMWGELIGIKVRPRKKEFRILGLDIQKKGDKILVQARLHSNLKNQPVKIQTELQYPSRNKKGAEESIHLGRKKREVLFSKEFPLAGEGRYNGIMRAVDTNGRLLETSNTCWADIFPKPDISVFVQNIVTNEDVLPVRVACESLQKGKMLRFNLLSYDKKKTFKTFSKNSAGDEHYEDIPISNIPEGCYILQVQLGMKEGEASFKKLSPVNHTITTIGRNGEFLVNGKRVIPKFIYGAHPWAMKDISENGYNCALLCGWDFWARGEKPDLGKLEKILESARRNNLGVFVNVCHAYRRKGIKFDKLDLESVRKIARKVKDNDCLWGWYIADEPCSIRGFGPPVKAVKELLEHEDPYHVAWLVVSYHDQTNFCSYNDVACRDVYPIGKKGREITDVSETIDASIRNAGWTKTPWVVLQAFGGQEKWHREPTPEEMRCMTYLSLAHGAKGIGDFIYKPKYVPLWEELGKLNRELVIIGKYLLGKGEETKAQVPGNNTLHLLRKELEDGKSLLIIANSGRKQEKIQIYLNTEKAKYKNCLLEEPWRKSVNGYLLDTIDPLDGKCYLISN